MLLNVVRGRDVELNTLGEGFKDYGRILGTMLLSSVYQFLWITPYWNTARAAFYEDLMKALRDIGEY